MKIKTFSLLANYVVGHYAFGQYSNVPFIRLGDRYYCFDLNNLFDNLYRVMQRIIMHLKPDYQETWNTIQKRQSENLPLKYLEHLLPGAKVLKEVYYRGKSDKGVTDWCETDGLVIYDDHLFIVEARRWCFYLHTSRDRFSSVYQIA